MEPTIKQNYNYLNEPTFKSLDMSFEDLKENNLVIEAPLWYHKQNLTQTSTGYGSKLTTTHKVKFNNRLYRIYVAQFSNAGTAYILVNKELIIIS